jgi:hypothetical protein
MNYKSRGKCYFYHFSSKSADKILILFLSIVCTFFKYSMRCNSISYITYNVVIIMQKSIRIDKEGYNICKQRLYVNERYQRIYVYYYTPRKRSSGGGVYWKHLVRPSIDAICPKFISNTAEQISFKLYAYISYMM